MALSTGARRAAGMAAGWLAVAGATAVSLVYFSEIKEGARMLLGIAAPDSMQATAARKPNHGPQPATRARGARMAEIKAGAHGHYYAGAEINGRSIGVMIDSGASIVALTFEDAERAGIFVRDSDYTHRVNTANGIARIAPVVLDRVSIGEVTVRNVPAAVSEPGKLMTSLLGMSFLSRLQRVDMRSGTLVLQE
jgi:aspartyl protease family protein